MMALKIIKRFALSLTFAAVGLTFVSLNGCYYDNRDDLEPFLGGISCDTAAVSYLNDILPVLQAECISCHSASNASGGINLEGFSKVKTQADNGKLLGSITYSSGYSPMPPGGAKLPACEISQIESWINTGTPDN
ncbi:MAG: c-type cytochrome domain-containing protein [Bacteroidia bacterium]|nr:c-type cytochrome domain-containing protein [Bacteroidia bacterium]